MLRERSLTTTRQWTCSLLGVEATRVRPVSVRIRSCPFTSPTMHQPGKRTHPPSLLSLPSILLQQRLEARVVAEGVPTELLDRGSSSMGSSRKGLKSELPPHFTDRYLLLPYPCNGISDDGMTLMTSLMGFF